MNTTAGISKDSAQADRKVCRKHGVPFVVENIENGLEYGSSWSYCPVCEKEEAEAARKKEAQEHYARMTAGIPYHYHAAHLDQFDAKFIAPVFAWVKKPKGFIYVHGGPGVGKTHLACAVKRDFNERGIFSQLVFSCEMFIRVNRTFHGNSAEHAADIIERVTDDRSAPVIFDDVGVQKDTAYTVDTWFNIIDRRYRADAPTMITTNHGPKDLADKVSSRVFSRIKSGLIFEFPEECKDRRYKEHWTERY